jgi:hypothetical protein
MLRGVAIALALGLIPAAGACLPSYEFTDGGASAEAGRDARTDGNDATTDARPSFDASDATVASDARDAGDADLAHADAADAADAGDARDAAAPPLSFVNQATVGLYDASAAGAVIDAQVAGDLNVVFVAWFQDPTPSVTSVTDTAGNAYLPISTAMNTTNVQGDATKQSVFYAANIRVPDGGGPNTITAATDRTAFFLDVRVAEYAGIAQALDNGNVVSLSTSQNAVADITPSQGAAVVVVGAGNSSDFVGSTNCQIRVLNNAGDLICDLPATGIPPLQVTLVNANNGGWVMQWVTFR